MNFQDYIVVRRSVGAGTLAADGLPIIEDDYGELNVSAFEDIVECWAAIKEVKSGLETQAGAILHNRRLEIVTDSRDATDVDLGDIVTINNLDNDEFVVTNKYQSEWRWRTTIIAEFTNR